MIDFNSDTKEGEVGQDNVQNPNVNISIIPFWYFKNIYFSISVKEEEEEDEEEEKDDGKDLQVLLDEANFQVKSEKNREEKWRKNYGKVLLDYTNFRASGAANKFHGQTLMICNS